MFRKPPYLMVKTMVSGRDFPSIQSLKMPVASPIYGNFFTTSTTTSWSRCPHIAAAAGHGPSQYHGLHPGEAQLPGPLHQRRVEGAGDAQSHHGTYGIFVHQDLEKAGKMMGKPWKKMLNNLKHLTFWENCKNSATTLGKLWKNHVFLGTWLKKHGKTCFWGEIAAKNVNMGLKWLEKWWKFEKRTWRTHVFSETCGNHGSCDKVGWHQNLFLACT